MIVKGQRLGENGENASIKFLPLENTDSAFTYYY